MPLRNELLDWAVLDGLALLRLPVRLAPQARRRRLAVDATLAMTDKEALRQALDLIERQEHALRVSHRECAIARAERDMLVAILKATQPGVRLPVAGPPEVRLTPAKEPAAVVIVVPAPDRAVGFEVLPAPRSRKKPRTCSLQGCGAQFIPRTRGHLRCPAHQRAWPGASMAPAIRPALQEPPEPSAPASAVVEAAIGVTPDDYEGWTQWARVRHRIFGDGQILRVARVGSDVRVTVRFADGRERVLVTRFAGLERL